MMPNLTRALVPATIIITFTLHLIASLQYFDHNDFFYASASSIEGRLYEELAFVQAPLTYWFWRGVYLISPEGQSYFTLRVVSSALSYMALLPWLLVISSSRATKILFLFAGVSSYYTMRSGYEIANYSLAALFASTGFALLILGRSKMALVAGLLLGLAASSKISFLLLIAPALMSTILILPKRGAGGALILSGWVAGATPLAYYVIRDVDLFLLNNIDFHSAITNSARGMTIKSSLIDITRDVYRFVVSQKMLFALVITSLVLVFHFRRGTRDETLDLPQQEDFAILQLILYATITSFLMAVSPMIMFDQYLSFPSLMLTVLLMFSFNFFSSEIRNFLHQLGIAYFAISLVSTYAPPVRNLLRVNDGVISQHNAGASAIRDVMPTGSERSYGSFDCEASAFSLSGSFLADTTLSLSQNAVSGPFWVGKGGFVPERYGYLTTIYLNDLTDPLAAILRNRIQYVLIGFYNDQEWSPNAMRFERGFQERAARLGYVPVASFEFLDRNMTLYRLQSCFS